MNEAVEEEVESIDERELYVTEEEFEEASSPEDSLEEEIVTPDIPDKFKGKELTDVIKSYQELESAFGRKNNEVGELRRLTDELLQLKLNDKPKQEEKKSVDVDALLNEPDRVLNEAVSSNPEVRKLQEQLLQMQRNEAKKAFEAKHSDWQSIVPSPEFQSWLEASPIRARMFVEANSNYDYATGDELLTLFKETRSVKTEQGKEIREEKAKKAMKSATAEKGSSGAVKKKVYKRAELINLKLQNPAKYEAMLPEIESAYREGRVR